ncbi:TetR/AcrR family transcriptional regulator [Demequina sp. NBRC 110057]|uniref:TetR/AcrR family transcriptional regulator n=1 Tax=Demequina sp. NBRC 110057 TaxID=1570346 RepID=UPI00117786AB|nr:TetR/AcrR family transcriptional regulator [Demequina sp. NBRC 110057]
MASTRGQARDAILAAASALFNAYGTRAVSADRILAEAGVSKVTFYRHFATKDALVVAYLEGELARLQELGTEANGDPQAIAGIFEEEMCRPGFRGCPFINAAAEYPDPAHPVREVVARFRAWMIGAIEAWAMQRGAAHPADVARQVMMLRDGALVEGYVTGDAERVARELRAGIAALAAA